MEDARNKMLVETDFLKDRSLLLESDEKDSVRMHDVVRDVCIFIAKENGYIGKDDCAWISTSHLVGEGNLLLSGSSSPKLNLLFLDNGYDDSSRFKFDDAFVEGMSEINVFFLQNYRSLTTLPYPKQSLGKLSTLIVDTCYKLETISVVGELRNLEILICRDCTSIERLPSEMKGLNCLKVLDLTGCRELNIGRGIIASLVGLEELKMRGSFCSWEGEDGEETENAGAQLRELEKLTNLACLEIDILDSSLLAENMPLFSSKIVRFIIRTQFHDIPSEFSKAMKLFNLERETRLGDWIEMQLLRDTEYLELYRNGANNMNLAKSQNIRWLEVSECESMKNIATTSGGSDDATVLFPSLEHLELESLPELQEICDGPISSTSFHNLKKLKLKRLALTQFWKSRSVCQTNNVPHFTNLSSIKIYECDGLRNLGQLSMAGKGYLPQLEKLTITYCSMMEQVFLLSNEEAIESQRKCQVITKVFPKLKVVKLDDLPNLTSFYQGIQGIELPLLGGMKIEKCPKMKRIVGGSSADIDDDASLHVLCQPTKVSFGSLEALDIDNVGSMSIFTLSMAANLVSLRELGITDCDELIKVIEDEQQQQRNILVFPKLEFLWLTSLHKLVSFCDSKCEVEFPLLRNVSIQRCPNMESFSMGLWKATPNLEAFKTDLSTYVGVGVHVAFNSLKQLMITENENPFYGNKISVSLFNGLETLKFYECKGGMSLFSSSTVRNLVNLRELEISHCDGMLVNVIEEEEEEGKVVSGDVFPKLEVLKLWSLPNLLSFSEWKCDVELPSLTKVEIEECPNMENFSMGFVAAPNLKIVKIGYEEIDATKDLNGALHQHYLARRRGRKLQVSIKVKINYNPFYGQKLHSSIFKRLGELRINWYVGSMSLFTLSVAANLVTLIKLFIEDCDEMIKVIEDEQQQERILVFPKLEELDLRGLPNLVTFCTCKCEVELPLLRKVTIQTCPNMESFSMEFVATPKLEAFTTDLTTYVGVGVDVAFTSLKELLIRVNENPWSDDKISVSLLNGLQKLEFYGCKGSMSLFSSSAVGNLVNLEELRIGRCDELVKVIEDREEEEEEEEDRKVVSGGKVMTLLLFPKLEELYLSKLPNVVSFCEWKCDIELPSLTKVDIFECRNIKYFSMGSVVAPYMKIVHRQ